MKYTYAVLTGSVNQLIKEVDKYIQVNNIMPMSFLELTQTVVN